MHVFALRLYYPVIEEGLLVYLRSRTVQKNSPSRNSQNDTGITFLHFPALPASIHNLSGAGDCLVAGTMVGLSSGSDVGSALAYGVSASKWAVESDFNVSPNLDHHSVLGKPPFSYSQSLLSSCDRNMLRHHERVVIISGSLYKSWLLDTMNYCVI